MHLSQYVNNIERRHSVNLRGLYAYANHVLTDTFNVIISISIKRTLMIVLMSRLSPLTHKLLAETTVGKFRFYEVVLCESFVNIVSGWGRVDEESKYLNDKFLSGI